ncbi:erythromycin esterase family protein [Spirillospora sp. CA-294931]|uniref:erythromycin esterase family protein n=1 Tax=Spirillospora sp. CA-294931 TaxID=3240042 RepID=UPI003D94B6A8
MQRRLIALAPLTAAALCLTAAPPVHAAEPANTAGPVTPWIKRNATRLTTTDPSAPLTDLASLGRTIGDAKIVGLGESAHGLKEQTRLKHRVLRLLVEKYGFRSLAWEEDWTLGVKINRYIRTGEGDLEALMRESDWRSGEVADVFRWLRRYNANRKDKVQFVGVEYYSTRPLAYDAIASYAAKAAPGLLPELRRHLKAIRPNTENMGDYVKWYWKLENKKPYIRHAREIHRLVASLPRDRAQSLALHHARQIVSFHEHFDLADPWPYRDARAAENLRWWQRRTGDKIAYWAASAHTANAPDLRITGTVLRFPSAGSHLRRWYGRQYRSVGFTFYRGTVLDDDGRPFAMPAPKNDWFERRFDGVPSDHFTLDLRRDAPAPVQRWLRAPASTRGIPTLGTASAMTGGSLAQWFDAIVHTRTVTPATRF